MVRDAATALASWKDPASWTSYRNVRFGFTSGIPVTSLYSNRTSPMSASSAFAPAMAGRHCELSERPTWLTGFSLSTRLSWSRSAMPMRRSTMRHGVTRGSCCRVLPEITSSMSV